MKPQPVPKNVVCSVCGLAWDRHGEKPTPEKCIELLKGDLAIAQSRATWNNIQPFYATGTTTLQAHN